MTRGDAVARATRALWRARAHYLLLTPAVPPAAGPEERPPAPVAAFVGDPLTGITPLPVQFTDQSTGDYDEWEWEKTEDGLTWVPFEGAPTDPNPEEEFTVGSWSVRLRITGPGGKSTATLPNYVNVEPVPEVVVLLDEFPDTASAPLTTPGTSLPGPGRRVFADNGSNISITANGLAIAGGTATWDQTVATWTNEDASFFARGSILEAAIKITTPGFAQVAWTAGGSTLAGARHAVMIFDDGKLLGRDQGATGGESAAPFDEYVGVFDAAVDYAIRIQPLYALPGCLIWTKGGHFGDAWRLVGWSNKEEPSPAAPFVNSYSLAGEIAQVRVLENQTQTLAPFIFNGGNYVGQQYKLGIGVYDFATKSCGMYLGNPRVATASGWETAGGTDILNAPNWVWTLDSADIVFYNNAPVPGYCRIGVMRSTNNGETWSKSGENPIITEDGEDWREFGVNFPVAWVYDDTWYMVVGGFNSDSEATLGLFSADDWEGPWSEVGTNPKLPLGTDTDPDTLRHLPGCLLWDGDTGKLLIQGARQDSFPDGGRIMLVEFDRTTPATGWQKIGVVAEPLTTATSLLTSNVTAGDTTVAVADSSVFPIGCVCILADKTGAVHQCRVVAATTGTSVTIAPAARANFATASDAKLECVLQSIVPRSMYRVGNKVWILTTAYQAGYLDNNAFVETTYLASADWPTFANWTWHHDKSPLWWLPLHGGTSAGWSFRVGENPCLRLDAETLEPVLINEIMEP